MTELVQPTTTVESSTLTAKPKKKTMKKTVKKTVKKTANNKRSFADILAAGKDNGFSKLIMPELKELLRHKKLKLSGKKK